MQLLTVVIPKLQQWQDQGEAGTKKINQWTRYVTVVLALLQSTGLVFLFHNRSQSGIDVFPGDTFTPANIALVILTFTAGTAMVMWLGELITQRGVGNGMSILIFTSVISRLPSEGHAILLQGGTGKFIVILSARPRDHRRGRLHGSGAAPDPHPVRQTGRRPAHDVRRQHVPAAQGEPGGRHPDHLRDVGPVLPDAAGERCPRLVVPGLRERTTSTTRRAWSTWRCSRC